LSAIKLNNLSFAYANVNKVGAFSLYIENMIVDEGEFLAVLGPNGCGKSTMLRLIAGLIRPNSGSIEIMKKITSPMDQAKLISYVPQISYSVFPFSVYEIVMMGRTPYLNMLGFEKEEDTRLVKEALNLLEIDHLSNKGINEISGGEAQRVFIARALAQDSKIILLDEPNSHLDLEHQISIYELLRSINLEKKKTILTVSHDLNLVGIYSKRVVILKQGKVVLDGDKKSILTKENIEESFHVEADVISGSDSSLNILIKPVK